jgi:SlyX protein
MSDERVKKLEERVAWLEHHVTQQDKAMLDMSRQLDRVQAELLRVRDRVSAAGDGAAGAPLDAAAERPPHY